MSLARCPPGRLALEATPHHHLLHLEQPAAGVAERFVRDMVKSARIRAHYVCGPTAGCVGPGAVTRYGEIVGHVPKYLFIHFV